MNRSNKTKRGAISDCAARGKVGRGICGVAILLRIRPGKSAVSRAAMFDESMRAEGISGNRAISSANFCVAIAPGKRVRLAASAHGSRSSRASAETTVTDVPLVSAPIGANKNSFLFIRRLELLPVLMSAAHVTPKDTIIWGGKRCRGRFGNYLGVDAAVVTRIL